MKKKLLALFVIALAVAPIVLMGCKARNQDMPEEMKQEDSTVQTTTAEETLVTEPSQVVATETIPPTAAPQIAEKPVVQVPQNPDRNRDIQKALKSAGFYTGTIDGKIGPKTKGAIVEFQKAKGLSADGKVGPKTWAELEKHLIAQ